MRKIEELSNEEYMDLVYACETEEDAREYCEFYGIDFEEVKESDWGYDWQIGTVGVY